MAAQHSLVARVSCIRATMVPSICNKCKARILSRRFNLNSLERRHSLRRGTLNRIRCYRHWPRPLAVRPSGSKLIWNCLRNWTRFFLECSLCHILRSKQSLPITCSLTQVVRGRRAKAVVLLPILRILCRHLRQAEGKPEVWTFSLSHLTSTDTHQ